MTVLNYELESDCSMINKELIKNVLQAYLDTNADVLDDEEKNPIKEQIKSLSTIEIDRDALTDFVSHNIYTYFIRFGRIQTFKDIKEYIYDFKMNVDDELIRNACELAADLYDENERSGANDEMYPYRKK